MIVVSDSGPVQYLVLTERVNAIQVFYEELIVPPAVVHELSQPTTPESVRAWISNHPSWVQIRAPISLLQMPDRLGKGEVEAISLATELGARLLIDDLDARKYVDQAAIPYTGTLGVLIEAHATGLYDIEESMQRLQSTSFRLTDDLVAKVIEIAVQSRSADH